MTIATLLDRTVWGPMDGAPIRVAELFAGVGGFRLGLEGEPGKNEVTGFEVIWSNQHEPGEKAQWASTIYEMQFGSEGHTNCDIHDFTDRVELAHAIPEHDLLVGGFPCQDYSVARTKSGEMGIEGEKGKLWEPIRKILRNVHANGTRNRPKVALLENVPRLLNSPANARGLNFAKILRDLLRMRYDVEWRVVNASDYGMPQQRSRVFILAYRTPGPGGGDEGSKINGLGHFGLHGPGRKNLKPMEWWMFGDPSDTSKEWKVGPFGKAFPAEFEIINDRTILPDLDYWSDKKAPFGNAGYAWSFRPGNEKRVMVFRSWKAKPIKEEPQTIRDIMVEKGEEGYDASYEVDESELPGWEYAKSEKKEFRIRKADKERWPELWETYRECIESQDQSVWDEHRQEFIDTLGDEGSYKYEEGQIAYPDSIDKPSRTVVTAEIGRSASRMRHLIRLDDGTWRRLMPVETERLNMFPPGWTDIPRIKPSRRGFLMGNALVVGVIDRLREPLLRRLKIGDSP